MNILSLDRISKTMGEKSLFKDISFGIEEGQKAALIGVNGCGKSTLLKMIAGVETIDQGSISKNNAVKISYLGQTPQFNPAHTILDHIFHESNPRAALIKRYELLCEQVSRGETRLQDELAALTTEMDKAQVWNYESEIKAVLNQLGISDLDHKMLNLSGGMLKRVALAQALIDDADLLLLDEPTNHLDTDTIIWLENYLKRNKQSLLMVTHDRYFLDQVCNTILELDDKTLYSYKGNYSYYLRKKAEVLELEKRTDRNIEGILRTELEWLKRGPKARGTKSKSRIQRINNLINRDRPREEQKVDFEVIGKKLGNKILEIQEIAKSFNNKVVINPFTYFFKERDRIGFVGKNGAGKSTLLNLITGRLQPDQGQTQLGVHTRIGYFDQHSMEMQPDLLLIDYIKQSAEVIEIPGGQKLTAARMLERFLFPASKHYTPIGHLSGGEKRRLHLLSILMKNPNFLILDEPTNDFDIISLGVLEEFLLSFQGCVIIVSHDRYFLDRITDQLFIFNGDGNIDSFNGNFSEYLEYRRENDAAEKTSQTFRIKDTRKKEEKEKTKLTFNEKKELAAIEPEIEALEKERREIEEGFGSMPFDKDRIKVMNTRLEEVKTLLEQKYERWEYLSQFEN